MGLLLRRGSPSARSARARFAQSRPNVSSQGRRPTTVARYPERPILQPKPHILWMTRTAPPCTRHTLFAYSSSVASATHELPPPEGDNLQDFRERSRALAGFAAPSKLVMRVRFPPPALARWLLALG